MTKDLAESLTERVVDYMAGTVSRELLTSEIRACLSTRDAEIAAKDALLIERDATIEALRKTIADLDTWIDDSKKDLAAEKERAEAYREVAMRRFANARVFCDRVEFTTGPITTGYEKEIGDLTDSEARKLLAEREGRKACPHNCQTQEEHDSHYPLIKEKP